MDHEKFSFRRYKEEDGTVLFYEYAKYLRANIQPYFSGMSVIPDENKFLKEIKEYSNKKYRPPFIADESDKLFGLYHLSYRHANGYYEVVLYLWRNNHLTRAILKQIITQVLSEQRPNDKLLVEVPGFDVDLLQAVNQLGLECVGRIPNYLCHDAEDAHAVVLHDKYLYWISSEKWHNSG